MALDPHAVRFIKKLDLNNKRVLMLGRQHDRTVFPAKFSEFRFYAQGASVVDSLDIDGSEGASIIGDLNKPLEMTQKYDLIWDGGTLEHVFNIPVALENVRRLLNIDGIFISQQSAVLSGHGYYSLSPELFFKWAGANGFSESECWSYPMSRLGRFFRLRKVEWENKRIEWTIIPRMYFFMSRKISEDVTEMPLQCYPSVVKSNLLYWLKTIFPNTFNPCPTNMQK